MTEREVIIKKIQSLADTDLQEVARLLHSLEMKKAAGSKSLMPSMRS